MGTLVIIGTQWGDEGKGKITNFLSKKSDYIVRYQGGDNAGHTVFIGNEKFVFHLLPSGIIEKNKICVIGNGVAINPVSLIDEIQLLEKRGINTKRRIFISFNAHIIMPYHKYIDQIYESNKTKIGTTKKGIGPAYSDKYNRIGIRVIDYLNDKIFYNLLENNLNEKKEIITKFTTIENLRREILETRRKLINKIKELATDTVSLINEAINQGKRILFEGAQGNMLDIDFGTYPYVTSSNPSVGGVCTGVGIPPQKIDNILGITKSYTTRVGEGPFPTELNNKIGEYLRNKGNEFGATTGRPRRCGWLDLVIVKHSALINGIKSIALTKLDVLSELNEIYVCYAYKFKNKIIKNFPYDRILIQNVQPVYKIFKGWKQNLNNIKTYDELPRTVKSFIKFIEDFLSLPISILSTSPERNKTIIKEKKYLKF